VAPAAGVTAPAATSATATLTLWSVAELEPQQGEGLGALADAWAASDPLTSLIVSRRPGRGEYGVIAYLDIISRVAPAALPDVVPLPLADVAAARQRGLILPLPLALADSAQLDQSWPFAREAVTHTQDDEERAWALPLAVTAPHIAWPTPKDAPPTSWQDLVLQARLALPDATDPTALSTALSLYAANGGDPSTLPAIDRDAAAAWLSALATGRESISLSPAPLTALAAGEVDAAIIGAGDFVEAWGSGEATGWSTLPGPTGPAPIVATGWALALVARPGADTGRGVALIEALSSEIAPTWTFSAGLLPANRAAWAESLRSLPDPPPSGYRDFIALRLESARHPAQLAGTAPRWSEATRAVLAGEEIVSVLDNLTAPR
jgi:hypothetical protein